MCTCERTMSVSGKCNDLCHIDLPEGEVDGYVPRDLNIGGGDYISFTVCMDCGKIQGEWPLPQEAGEES